MEDAGDKITAEDKAPVEEKIAQLEEALKGTDIEAIKAKQEELQKSIYAISEKLYQNVASQQAADGAAPGPDTGSAEAQSTNADYVDADFTEVQDDDQK